MHVLRLSCQEIVTQLGLEQVKIPKVPLACSNNAMVNQCTAFFSLEDQIGSVLSFMGLAVVIPSLPP
jgi:hypothetical protein